VESTSPTMASAAPTSSATPTVSAPSLASPQGISAPSSYQAAPQAPMGQQAPTGYQPMAAPQASAAPAAAANPWQEAFQALSASLNTPQASPAQASYSAYQTPTTQASTQASWGSPAQNQWASQAQQTYAPQASTQGYSAQEMAQIQQLVSQQQHAAQAQAQAQYLSQSQSAPSDSYLSQISDVSLEVLEHFGAEAPALLNHYACAVEDALIEQVGRNGTMNLMLDAASEERAAMNIMLTNPDVLADYVNGFFGPQGPYPTLTASEKAQVAEYRARAEFANEIAQQEERGVPSNFQRPVMDMPTPGRQQSQANSFWGDFSQLMDNNPENAWQYLSGAPAQAFQSKMLVQDF